MDLSEYIVEPLRKNEEFTLFRGQHRNPGEAKRSSILLMAPLSSRPAPSSSRQIEHEYSLPSELDMGWTARPVGVVQYDGQPVLVLENRPDESPETLIPRPMKTGQFLRIALVKAFEEIKRLNDRLQTQNTEGAEKATLASERNLSLIINAMPVLAWSAQPDGSVDFFNQRWLDYTGLSLSEARGWGWAKAVHPDDFDRLNDYWGSRIVSGEPGEIEARLRKFDGNYRWFLFRGEPFRDESGVIVRWYGTITDIHGRKLAQERMLRSEAFLAEAQHLARVGSFSWRVATGEIKWSEQLYRIFEFDPGISVTFDVMGSRYHPEDLPLLDDMIGRARSAVTDLEYEYRLRMPDGSVKFLHLVAHANRDHEGRLEYIGAVQDVTQRQLSETALAKARAELAKVTSATSLGIMTASIAHEVNQPLSGIMTNVATCLRMLDSDPPNVDGARQTVRRAIRDGSRASDVITRLRTLFGKKEVADEPVDLNEATREVITLCLSELQRNQVILQLEFADTLPAVRGDRIQLQQVVLNLVRNASEAMNDVEDRPRRLVIGTEIEGSNVRVRVQDSGIGFSPEACARLFESFYTTKQDGMGIGLSVSRSIIEAHHGKLWATPNDGPGVTFTFSVPCEPSS